MWPSYCSCCGIAIATTYFFVNTAWVYFDCIICKLELIESIDVFNKKRNSTLWDVQGYIVAAQKYFIIVWVLIVGQARVCMY